MRRKIKSSIKFLITFSLTIILCFLSASAIALNPQAPLVQQKLSATNTQALEQAGKVQFDTRHFTDAAMLLQQVVQSYQAENDPLGQAIALGNLALAYQQLGQWQDAERAIAESLKLLENVESTAVLAQVLETQGSLQFAQGQSQQAWNTWEQAVQLYQQADDNAGLIRSRINQSQALQRLGRYRRTIATLTDLAEILRSQPDNLVKVVGLRSLGDALRVADSLAESERILQQSLSMAKGLDVPGRDNAIAEAYLSLGNTAYAQQNFTAALGYYQQANQLSATVNTRLSSQLNQFSLLLDQQQWNAAKELLADIQVQLDALPPSGALLDAQMNFAYHLIRLKQATELPALGWVDIARMLTQVKVQAVEWGDRRAASYALGILGSLYEKTEQWEIAQDLTGQALQQAQAINNTDILYRWQWQQGRLLGALHKDTAAIAAYDAAVQTLRSLRRDVVVSNINFQFAFRQQTEEPLYREFLDLLLQPETPEQNKLEPARQRANLGKARQVITSLQVLQLENFLQEPCADATPQELEKLLEKEAPTTAIFYPIILKDRLEVIYKLPQESQLQHYRSLVSADELRQTIRQLQLDLEEEYTFTAVQAGAQKLYRWMLEPARKVLQQKGIDTLVFALDGVLRNVPMAVLYDGKQYLMENYAIALAPDLSLPNPRSLQVDQLKVLAVGLTDPPKNVEGVPVNFAQLKNVNQELDSIAASRIPVAALRDQAFTGERFNTVINQAKFPIIHMATHGQFSSDPHNAFLLTSNGEIGINDLDSIFRVRGQLRPDLVELLILSACETAIGDDLATLGIAGAAFRAGARSAIASLWSLDDAFGVEFTRQLYQNLGQPGITKAVALQRAQKALLTNPQYEHPRYWATYVLIGNWL
jgi:CHAT domain-containing protein/predicted negative regulator of RcsB-dependent stress response